MSIIIRLQNLPLPAKSGDIRRFFGGLRIPNGGVHIVGGNKGDAFIAFTTDEDARLAMRKDGGKILETRVKLYLSSRVEMQQEIGRITREDPDAPHQRSPTGRQRSSRSPPDERDTNYDRNYRSSSPNRNRRCRSPYDRRSRSRSPRRRSRSPRRRSRSPRRRSRSPIMSSGSRRSRSPIQRTSMASASQRPTSPHRSNVGGSLFGHENDAGAHGDGKLVDIEKLFGLAKGSTNWNGQDFARREEQALLEQKIAEALSASLSSIGKMTGIYQNPERVNEAPMDMQGERMGEPMGNMQGGRIGEPGINMQGGRFVQPGFGIQGGRIGEPSIDMQARFIEPGFNMQGGRIGEPNINMQGGRIGEPNIIMQGRRIGEPNINMQGGRIGEPNINMQGGRIGEPNINMQGGRIGEPNINMQGGRIGEPNINMQGGRIGDSSINMQGRRVIEHGLNLQGGRIGDFGINMPVGRGGEQFANLNPNLMPFQPEYNSSGLREVPIQENNNLILPNMPPPINRNIQTNFTSSVQPLQYPPPMNTHMPPMVNLPPPMPISTMPPPLAMPPPSLGPMPPPSLGPMPPANMPPNTHNMLNPNILLRGFFVTISGLHPLWNFNEIQNMLKGVFVPSKNIKWELDDKWSKTGTAFVKLYNKGDFMQLLSCPTYSYNSRLITVSDFPDFVFHKYFAPEVPSEGSLNSPSGEFYYKITGLPYEANYDNVLSFFDGLEVTDLYIIYSKSSQGFRIQGKATGIAFIVFGNSGDCSKAMSKNGQRFENSKRVVNVANSCKKSMLEAKQKNCDLLSQSVTFVRATGPAALDGGSFQTHPLCTLLTGLPQNVSKGKIINFFKKLKSNPGTIHITLNEEQKPNGRAFVEFNSLQDFDAARQCHGQKIGDKIICVKQILYDEMTKCIKSQQRSSFENVPQNSMHPYSHSPTEMFRNQPDPGKHFPIEDNFRPTYNSQRNVIQVFEYGNKSREPMPVPDTTSNSLNRQKPLKPCIKPTKPYKEDFHQNPCPPSGLPLKNDLKSDQTLKSSEFKKPESSSRNVAQKFNQSAHSEESRKPELSSKNVVQKFNQSAHNEEPEKPESSSRNVAQKFNQSAHSEESRKPESSSRNVAQKFNQSAHSEESRKPELSSKNVVQKFNQSALNEEPKKPESRNVAQKFNQSTHSAESKKPELPFRNEVQKSNHSVHSDESKKPEPSFKNEIKKSDQSTHSGVSNQIEMDKEAIKIKIEMEEAARNPVKFEVKIKPAISKSIKVEDAFSNVDTKKKLSKLSPERVPAVSSKLPSVVEKDKSVKSTADDKNVVNKSDDKKVEAKKTEDDKNVKIKKTEEDKNVKIKKTEEDKTVKIKKTEDDKNVKTKETVDHKNIRTKKTEDDKSANTKKTEDDKNTKNKNSVNDKNVKSHEDTSKPKTKSTEDSKKSEKAKSSETQFSSRRESKDSKNYRSRNQSRDRNSRRYNEDRRRSPVRSIARKRPISKSPPSRSSYPDLDPYTRNRPADDMAIVQLCNVDPLVGSAELLHFFYEFTIDADKIIRRIDDRGEPTGDVRVSFRNHRVAEIAIRSLNGSYLNGLPVSMFIVD